MVYTVSAGEIEPPETIRTSLENLRLVDHGGGPLASWSKDIRNIKNGLLRLNGLLASFIFLYRRSVIWV